MLPTKPSLLAALAAAVALSTSPAVAQRAEPAEAVSLSLAEAIELGLRRNPRVIQAGHARSAAGGEVWNAWGNLLPQVSLSGQTQKSERGSFAFFGRQFESPETFTTAYQWDFVHSLLDAGRDWYRIKGARANVDKALADYDARALEIATEIEVRYLEALRGRALVRQAEREIERRDQHLRLAEARHEVGEVTRSDLLQARLERNQGEVSALQARQRAEEARLALRRLLGGALPPGPLNLTTEFRVFAPNFDAEELIAQASERHPGLRELSAQERADRASLWIARTAYLPSLQFQYSLSRSVVDTTDFRFDDFDERDFYVLSLNWPLFGRFERYAETSRANASLRSTRQEERRLRLTIEESVRVALSRLRAARAAHEASLASVELGREDLRLAEARYETGTGSFLDLVDARVRAAQAETDLIAATYDFFLALVELERATGLEMMPREVLR
ncbi:MAG: TolC family protein [Gemmatimonadota bacterium]|nr:TolC family protein [Gemmatimonadota bacterium]